MYVRTYVCMYVCMYVCTYIYHIYIVINSNWFFGLISAIKLYTVVISRIKLTSNFNNLMLNQAPY